MELAALAIAFVLTVILAVGLRRRVWRAAPRGGVRRPTLEAGAAVAFRGEDGVVLADGSGLFANSDVVTAIVREKTRMIAGELELPGTLRAPTQPAPLVVDKPVASAAGLGSSVDDGWD